MKTILETAVTALVASIVFAKLSKLKKPNL